MLKSRKSIVPVCLIYGLCLFMLSCVSSAPPLQPPTPPPAPEIFCEAPSGKQLAGVIEQTKKVLGNAECHNEFDTLFENILIVGEGDSKPGNKKLIADFLEWCYNEQILFRNTAREYYGTYFSQRFVSLENYPKICAQCDKLDNIIKGIEIEMKKKERGLYKICKDEQTYRNVEIIKNRSVLLLTATCEACKN